MKTKSEMRKHLARAFLALSLTTSCIPYHAYRLSTAYRSQSTQRFSERVWVNDQVIASEDINPLRRRTARRLPSAVRSALNAAGFKNVTRDYAAVHDLSLAMTIDDTTAAMRVERNGRVIDVFNIRTSRI